MSKEKVIEATNRMEELVIIGKTMVADIRNGVETDPYTAFYWLRRELGYVVAELGMGQPSAVKLENTRRIYEPIYEENS